MRFWSLFPGVHAQNFLGDMNQVLACVFVVLTWKYFGLHMLLYMAGLQNIPKEIEEAAMIDGANRWQTVRNVTIPLLGSTIRTTILLVRFGFADPVQPDLDHDQGWAGQRQ